MSKFFLNLEKPDREGHQWKSTEKLKSSLKKLRLWSVFVFGFLFFYLSQNSNLLFAEVALLDPNQCDFQGVKYDLDSNTQIATVVGYNSEPSGAITIPKTVSYNGKDYTVTSIGDWAFYGCSGLTSVTFPASLTSIGESAFEYCSGLTSVDFSKCTSLESIGNYAFNRCSGLTSVDLSGCTSLTSIGNYAFAYCSGLELVVVSGGDVEWGSYVFGYVDDKYDWQSYDYCTVVFQDSAGNTLQTQFVFTGEDKPAKAKNPDEYGIMATWYMDGETNVFDFSTTFTGSGKIVLKTKN